MAVLVYLLCISIYFVYIFLLKPKMYVHIYVYTVMYERPFTTDFRVIRKVRWKSNRFSFFFTLPGDLEFG